MRVRILKSKAPYCARAFCSPRPQPPLERMSMHLAGVFRTNTASLGINVAALPRWIPRVAFVTRSNPCVAFVGTAARARPCGHAFFMFRALARGSAGFDVSFTRRAGRRLALSRRNECRAEERRNGKSRDRKFGSHQKVS